MSVLGYIGIGSNLGDRLAYLIRAVDELDNSPDVSVLRRSAVYETDPVGPPGQEAYYNAVIEVETSLDPVALVAECKRVEGVLGREHRERWGSREIDLDLLLLGDKICVTTAVEVPHRNLHERGFVLVPLAELNLDLLHPTLNQTVGALLDALPQPNGIRGRVDTPTAWIRTTD